MKNILKKYRKTQRIESKRVIPVKNANSGAKCSNPKPISLLNAG